MPDDAIPDITTLDPMYDRLIVDADNVGETSKGGVFLPTEARPSPDTGRVLAVGPGRQDNFGVVHPLPVFVGESILFSQHAGTQIQVDGRPYLILNGGDILAVIRTAEQRKANEETRALFEQLDGAARDADKPDGGEAPQD